MQECEKKKKNAVQQTWTKVTEAAAKKKEEALQKHPLTKWGPHLDP